MSSPDIDPVEEAMARAQQMSSQISTIGGANASNGVSIGMKRSLDDDSDPSVAPKRANVNEKVAAAAEAAAKLAQKLGGSSAPIQNIPPVGVTTTSFPQSPNATTVVHTIPDRFVGLVIGKKGEQITHIQAVCECKVQIAPDSNGLPDRTCTLTGTKEQIDRVKRMLDDIIDNAEKTTTQFNATDLPNGQTFIEIPVPGPKVGLVIGKSGETIKKLQEETGVKMVMIQDTNQLTMQDKPLRISGEPSRVEKARQLVMDLLASKDMSIKVPEYRSGDDYREMRVPRCAVGLVIGRGGEMLKKLSEEAGARVQFKQDGPNDFDLPERVLQISGPADGCENAIKRVQQLIDSTLQRQGLHGGGGGGGGNEYRVQTTYAVPAEKAGLVIGKGGETVKDITKQSGAHVEIQKQPPPNPSIKIFNVNGTQQQNDHAIRLICERAGIPPPPGGSGQGQYGQYGQYGQPSQWGGGQPGGTVMPPPAVNPSTGQPDYSAAWAEYYRRQGMHDYADAILRQAQTQGVSGAAPQQAGPVAPTPQVPGQPAPGGYDYAQWQQWQQYAQWQQQWAGYQQQQAGGQPPASSGH